MIRRKMNRAYELGVVVGTERANDYDYTDEDERMALRMWWVDRFLA